jgi:hypothetical protein
MLLGLLGAASFALVSTNGTGAGPRARLVLHAGFVLALAAACGVELPEGVAPDDVEAARLPGPRRPGAVGRPRRAVWPTPRPAGGT